jgi:uncharacterized protein YkwD
MSDYNSISNKVFEIVNMVRTDPNSLVKILSDNIKYFRGNVYMKPGHDAIQTVESRAAYEEAIQFLKNQTPVPSLTLSEILSNACRDHINDIGQRGVTLHDSSDSSNSSDRIERYGEWDGALAENIEFGSRTAEDVVISWIVDDGVKNRIHRTNLFHPIFKFAGVSFGEHMKYGNMCVMNYTAGVRNKGEDNTNLNNYFYKTSKKAFQEEDPDAPNDVTSVKYQKRIKIINGKEKNISKKIYTLKDGTQHIVEIEEI